MAFDESVFGYDGVDPTGAMEGLVRGSDGTRMAENTKVNPTAVMERLLRKGLEDYDSRARRIQNRAPPKTLEPKEAPDLGQYGAEAPPPASTAQPKEGDL